MVHGAWGKGHGRVAGDGDRDGDDGGGDIIVLIIIIIIKKKGETSREELVS